MRPLIVSLIPRSLPPVIYDRLAEIGDVVFWPSLDPARRTEAAERAQVLIATSSSRVDKAVLDTFPNVRMIGDFGVGFDGYDTAEIARRGIHLSHTPGVLSDDVADLAFALMLDAARLMPASDRLVHEGRWPQGGMPLGVKVSGKRIGIAGLGRIGMEIARRAEGFKMTVGYTARTDKNVPWQRFPDMRALAEWSDFLVVVIPGSPETHHLVNAEVLAALGPKGFLINVARGSLVDTTALIRALESGTIAGAGLDVFEHEPYVEDQLRRLPNAVLTPHVGSATVETRTAMAHLVADNVKAWTEKRPLITPVPGTERDPD